MFKRIVRPVLTTKRSFTCVPDTSILNQQHPFDEDISVKQASTSNDSTHFKGFISKRYSVGDAPNGGYMMSIAIEAALKCIPFPNPLSVSGHYLNKGIEEHECDIEVKVLSKSRSAACVEMSVFQQNNIKCKFIGTFGTLCTMVGTTKVNDSCPELPPLGECVDASKMIRRAFGEGLRVARTFDMKLPKTDPFTQTTLVKKIGETASMQGWIRFNGGRNVDLNSLAFLCDALPPPVLNICKSTWIPTLEYTVHFWGLPIVTETSVEPKNSWVRARFVSNHVENGLLHTDGDIWSEDGTKLLARSRQLARILLPRK